MWKGRLSMRYHGVNQISAFHFVRKWLSGEVTLSQIPELVGLTRSAITMRHIKEKHYKKYRAEVGSRQAVSQVESFNQWKTFLNSKKLHTIADITMYGIPQLLDSFTKVSLTPAEHSQLLGFAKNKYRFCKQTKRWWIHAYFVELQSSGYFKRPLLTHEELVRKPFHWHRDELISFPDPPGEAPPLPEVLRSYRSLTPAKPTPPPIPTWLHSSSVAPKFKTMLAGIHAEMHTMDKWSRATEALNELCALVPIRRGTRAHKRIVQFVPAAHPADEMNQR